MANKFFVCQKCGNMVGMIHASGLPMVCCGQPMTALIPGAIDAAQEKHVPAITVEGDTVQVSVGSILHPSTPEHFIPWVYLETEHGGQRKNIEPGQEPKVSFKVIDDKPLKVYAYCNLHGLWVAEVK